MFLFPLFYVIREFHRFLHRGKAECLELIKGRKQFQTAPHLRFDKFHQNKRIGLKIQRCVLESFAYLFSFSWVPDLILSRRKSLLNTKLAFPGMAGTLFSFVNNTRFTTVFSEVSIQFEALLIQASLFLFSFFRGIRGKLS